MARRRKKVQEFALNLDSFMDIITNGIGVIIVITLIAVINTSEMTFIFRTPLVRKTDKEPLFFECSNQRVTFVDKSNLDKQLTQYTNMIQNRGLTDEQVQEILTSKKYVVESSHYQVDLNSFHQDNLMILTPKGIFQGESMQRLDQSESEYKDLVTKIDPERNFVFFLVRPDSFDVFRKARKMLWDAKIEAGWEPLKPGRSITFGSVGRRAVVD